MIRRIVPIARESDTEAHRGLMRMDEVVRIFNERHPDKSINRKYASVILSSARRKLIPQLLEVLEWYQSEITR